MAVRGRQWLPRNDEAKAKPANGKAEAKKPKPKFSIPKVFSKPSQQSSLFQAFREVEIDAEVLWLRMQTESIEHGRGKGAVRNFAFRKFKEQPKALVVAGEDIIEIRLDSVTSFQNGPRSFRRDVLYRYHSLAVLYILPGGGPWNQKSSQGNNFDGVQNPAGKDS